MAEMMQQSAGQITNLIDEIIGLSLIETSTIAVRGDLIKVNEQLNTIVANFEEALQPGVTLTVESELEPDYAFATNKGMFSRIVNALIDNAIKYTEKGSIVVKASAFARALTIAVEDTGCGVPAKEAENIFGRFVKLDSFKQGIGLGLPLSRKLAEQLGGTVTLDTSYHAGARFVVTLPIQQALLHGSRL